jgi:hypothetical protein
MTAWRRMQLGSEIGHEFFVIRFAPSILGDRMFNSLGEPC